MNQSVIKKLTLASQNSLINHLLFWVLTYFVLVNIFANNSQIFPVDRIYTFIFMVTLAIPVYINLSGWIPRLLRPKKYFYYLIALLVTLAIGVAFNSILFSYLIDYLLPGYYFISYYTLWDLTKFFAAFLVASSLLKLSKEWFQLVESKQKLAEIEKEKVDIELKALRAQVNPHFLFNTLNVLYTLALKKSDETPEVIIKLSDLLRYVIYNSNKEKVLLSTELEQIKNYISLQSHRMEESAKVTFKSQIEKDIHIPPMLLMPLVENSFKHGIKGDLAHTFIHIEVQVDNNDLSFEIENNLAEESEKQEGEHGVGLVNIRNRLALLYPEQHLFEISQNESIFKVSLKIKHEN
ncbi:sensor histidine kinase [Echinicola sp. 20G]|uniref:sensor histidine kinase n=1 Tax=Echinicola sp. 20G TaxID=2781961 RepID=UPI0019104E54|nr:histidine kinase [Echinicola sp. 20G]